MASTRHIPELLAPAGDFVSLGAAIQGGGDAVYFGVSGPFNMRQAAGNFRLEDLPEVSRICRSAGVKAYLAANTLVFDPELPELRRLLETAVGRVDAVIGWDPAVLLACRELGLPVHVSTQASVANRAAANLYRQLGASRLVLARECTLEEVTAIRQASGLEVEVFVHGAMCMAVSGRCFLSQAVFGKSGNRGDCLQNCRRQYRVTDTDGEGDFIIGEGQVMSAQDLCCLPFLEQVLATGADSLKIEGRNRSAHYVRTVVSAYRRALDAWAAGTLDAGLKEELTAELARVFHRGFSSGFCFGRPVASFTEAEGSQASESRQFVGKVVNHYARPGVAEILVQDQVFGVGDRLCFEGPTTGTESLEVSEVRQEEQPVPAVVRGRATLKLPFVVRENDKVYRLVRKKDGR